MPEQQPSGNGKSRTADLRANRAQLQMLSALLDRAHFAHTAGLTFPTDVLDVSSLFKRDIYAALGYKRSLGPEDYREKYDRGGIAERIVEAFPNATWRGGGAVIEDEDPDNETVFEAAFNELAKRLGLWPALKRTDVLAGLGHFAILLVGAPGSLEEPLETARPEDIFGLWPYSEKHVTIDKVEESAESPRWGLPLFYALKASDISKATGVRGSDKPRKVHYSRVIHVADGRLDNEILGKPRLRSIWNYLEDLQKIHGAGAEAFWRNANQKMQLDLDPEVTLTPDEEERIEDEIDEMRHDLRDVFRTRGLDIHEFGARTAAFNQNLDAILTLVASTTGIPKRILLGSERGELASTQDRSNWNERVTARRADFAEPVVVRPLVDLFIRVGALPPPAAGVDAYQVVWPDADVLTDVEKIGVADKMASINERQFRAGQPPAFTDSEIREITGRAPLADPVPVAEPREAADGVKEADEPWRPVQDAAEAHDDQMTAAIERALDGIGDALDADEIEALVAAGDRTGLRTALETGARASFDDAAEQIAGVLLSALIAGGEAAADSARARHSLFRAAQLDIAFDVTNPRARQWALHRAGLLIQEAEAGVSISATTLQGIRDLITMGFDLGVPPKRTAQFLRDTVGLTGNQAGYVNALRAEMLNAEPGDLITRFPKGPLRDVQGFRARVPSGGATPEWIEQRIAQYSRMQLNWRARNIARSETLRASQEGQRQLWMQAQSTGLLPDDVERQRLVTPDDRLCPICAAGAGARAKVGEPYPDTGDTTPLMHPSCRCGEGLVAPGSNLRSALAWLWPFGRQEDRHAA